MNSYPSDAEAQQGTEDSQLQHLQKAVDLTERDVFHLGIFG